MSVVDVANGLVGLCRQGKFTEAIEKYYSDDIVSVEPVGSEQMPAVMEGIAAVKGKNQWWADNHEVHGLEVEGPFVGESQFAVRLTLDATAKHMGNQRSKFTEMALYTVAGDKIVKEEFYYAPPPSAA